eukprot:821730-Pyramimonas_sp.AAC.1
MLLAALVLPDLGIRAEPTPVRLQPHRRAGSRELCEEQDVLLGTADEQIFLTPGAVPVQLETLGVLLLDICRGPQTPDVRLHDNALVAPQPALHAPRAVEGPEVRAHRWP